MAGVSALLQSVTSQWRKQSKTSRQKTSSLRRSVRPSRRKRADSEEDSSSISSDTQEQLEVIAPKLSDLQFKYNWDIKHFVDKVRESEEGLNSRPFTIAVPGLTTLWSLSVRCWTQDGGVKLANPVVICLNLLSVSSSRFSDASINFQFGVYNINLKHFTMGKLEKAKIALKSTDKLKSVGYQNVYLGEANMDPVTGKVRLGMRLSLTVDDNQETCRSGLGRLIDDEKSSDMTITCKDRVFKVHKNILSAQSDVMSQLLTSDSVDSECKASVTSESYNVTDDEAEDIRKTSVMSEAYIVSDDENEEIENKSNVSKNSSGVSIDNLSNFTPKKSRQNIKMLDVDQEVCLKFLDFLYTGQYGLNDEDTLESLLCLSHEYQVAELKKLCEESLVENMQETNVAAYLYLSHVYGCSLLKLAALDFCRLNHQNIIKDSQWKKIESEVPDLYCEAVTSLETPEPCRDHLRCIQESGTRYKAETGNKAIRS